MRQEKPEKSKQQKDAAEQKLTAAKHRETGTMRLHRKPLIARHSRRHLTSLTRERITLVRMESTPGRVSMVSRRRRSSSS